MALSSWSTAQTSETLSVLVSTAVEAVEAVGIRNVYPVDFLWQKYVLIGYVREYSRIITAIIENETRSDLLRLVGNV